ncbi:MAG: histidine--tRNA ligase [Actinomycetota bacterium]|nr:histidine--tRNA ligase [Actinomycetota bacterium]
MELSPPRGTGDLLPPRSNTLRTLAGTAHRLAAVYGFRYVETPAFERTELFARTSGESSDVVRKEMYTFEDRKGRSLTLRPEGTAPVVRAVLAAGQELPTPFKGYYVEHMWRYGRPQTGRLREFRQFGVETIGTDAPEADVEVIALGERYLRAAGVESFSLELNSIGDETCRPGYREELISYLEGHVAELTDEHRERFRDNPLRVLDCKDPACRAVSRDAPKIVDRLCDACRAHFDAVVAGLEEEGLKANLVPTLVRGLDYYTRTTFEYVSDELPEGQASLGGGGRYDGLAEALGGPPTPGVGFALGLERIELALGDRGTEASALDVFVVAVGDDPATGSAARLLVRTLRDAGISADAALGARAIKGQLRAADRTGAAYAAILGMRELAEGSVTMRDLSSGTQEPVRIEDVLTWISRRR